MRSSDGKKRLAALATIFCALFCSPLMSKTVNSRTLTPSLVMNIAVTNNANREILHLYLSPIDRDAWGPDLLTEGNVLRTGTTFTITDAVCTGNEIKVIAEDRQGCFLYAVVGCAEASTGWTITDATPVDCGN